MMMKHVFFRPRPASRSALTAVAFLLAALAAPAQAQFGSLFQSLMQAPMQQAQQQQAAQAAAQANQKPAKRWAATAPVPPEVQAAALAFAEKMPSAELRPLFQRLYIEGERNATLNFQRVGMAALAAGNIDLAEKAFDAAVTRIDLIYADNPEAQKAKSLWTAEKIKDYKGEPYERAMAHFYRGLVYAARGDFQNARALFKQADYQDTVAEAEQYAGDFGLMPYMAGWASYCDGNSGMARDFLQQAIKGDSNFSTMRVDQPVLVLFESGRSPFKYGSGKSGEILKWQPHEVPVETATTACTAAGASGCTVGSFVMGADLGFQATTRGGRPIDGVLNGKASFKEGAQDIAKVASAVGDFGMMAAASTGNRDAAGLGMLGMFAGLVAQGVANATQAQADIREWEQLPAKVWLGTGAQKTTAGSLSVALDNAGTVSHVSAARLVNTPACQLYWGRSLAPLSLLAEAGPLEAGVHPRDPVFRQELEAALAN
jgi:tetratricopeptide (TPR) repeat protein